MTVFEQVLWMLVNIRLLGRQPRFPLPGESLIHYAAALEIQYSRVCMHLRQARRREAAAIAWRIVGLLGLTEGAEPIPPRLLVLPEPIEGSGRRRFCRLELAEKRSGLAADPQPALPRGRISPTHNSPSHTLRLGDEASGLDSLEPSNHATQPNTSK